GSAAIARIEVSTSAKTADGEKGLGISVPPQAHQFPIMSSACQADGVQTKTAALEPLCLVNGSSSLKLNWTLLGRQGLYMRPIHGALLAFGLRLVALDYPVVLVGLTHRA